MLAPLVDAATLDPERSLKLPEQRATARSR
jgi:hypothetical protein